MSMTLTAPTSDTQLWNRLIDPDRADLTPEAARYFLTLEYSDADRQRMHDLAVRNQDGELSVDEEAALASYRRVGMQLDILRAKARLSLRRAAG